MKTLNWYITKNLLLSTLIALGILTFVMLSGQFFKAFDLVVRGISPVVLAKFLAYLLPDSFRFTLPLSLLIATVLVFSRLSADNEIVAMKAMGISLWQVISPALILSLLFSGICFYLSMFVTPDFRYKAQRLRWETAAETPLALLEPGNFTEVATGCMLRVEEREGDLLKGVHLVIRDKKGEEVQDITARSGRVMVNPEELVLELALEEARVTGLHLSGHPSPENLRMLNAQTIRVPLAYGIKARKKLMRKLSFMNLKMLCARYMQNLEKGLPVSEILTNFHQRLALALSPFSFFLIGLPFGIRSKRSELSVGLLICVLLAVFFYAFMLLGNAMKEVSWMRPQYLLWIPNLLYQIVGISLLRKLEQKV